MTTTQLPPVRPEQHFVFEDADWSFYEYMLERVGDSPRVRINYDRGRLEIMTVSNLHEAVKKTIARLLEAYVLEKDIPVTGYGSVTCRSENLARGLEPDECYYVSTPAPPPTTGTPGPLDLTSNPPPDLAIEVDVTRSSIPRQPIYGAFGVPEIWRWDGEQVVVLHRQADGTYVTGDRSACLPDLPMHRFNEFLRMAITQDQHTALRALRDWIRAGGN